jgi:hypothetical protein
MRGDAGQGRCGCGRCGTGRCGTESAGINRHIVGDEAFSGTGLFGDRRTNPHPSELEDWMYLCNQGRPKWPRLARSQRQKRPPPRGGTL